MGQSVVGHTRHKPCDSVKGRHAGRRKGQHQEPFKDHARFKRKLASDCE